MLLQYACYNQWANNKLLDVLREIPDEVLDTEAASSFNSLRKTVYHTWGAEDVWLQRIQLVANPAPVAIGFIGTFADACDQWQSTSRMLAQMAGQTDEILNRPIAYRDFKGNPWETPLAEILHHVFNHGTHHRGQMITMLRQMGATEIPATDFIAYVRLKK